MEDLQVQLEKEASRRSQLEKVNGELKDQLASLKSLSRSNDLLERSKRQLEEEVLDLRRRMETAQMEQSQVQQYRHDAEERARQELQQKLEQVNLFLQVKILIGEFCWIYRPKNSSSKPVHSTTTFTKRKIEIQIENLVSIVICCGYL